MLAEAREYAISAVIEDHHFIYWILLGSAWAWFQWSRDKKNREQAERLSAIRHRDQERQFEHMQEQTRLANEQWGAERLTQKQARAEVLLELAREGRIHLTDSELAQAAKDAP